MSQTIPSANDVLMGGGGAATAKFTNPGDTVGGRIVADPRVYQEREYDPRNPGNGALKVYPKSGDPIMSLSVDVQTDLRDPQDPEDDGLRRIYIEGKRLKDAVRDAVRTSGGRGLEIGGHLSVTYTGLGQAEAGMNAPKLYSATYRPPASQASQVLMGGARADSIAKATRAIGLDAQPAAAPTPAPAPTVGVPDPGQVQVAQALIAAGQPDAVIAASCPSLTPEVVQGLRNANAA